MFAWLNEALLSGGEKQKDCNYPHDAYESKCHVVTTTSALDQNSVDVLLTLLKKVQQSHNTSHIS